MYDAAIRPLREGTTTLKISFGTGARRLATSVEVTAFPSLQVLVPIVMKTTLVVDDDIMELASNSGASCPQLSFLLGHCQNSIVWWATTSWYERHG